MTSYDQFPYQSYPFPQSHPERLATIAALLGLRPKTIAGARILELGCGSGGNLLPIAQAFPTARVVGVDTSRVAIAEGKAAIAAAGLTNAELLETDLREINASLGAFDYIISHGVFSWILPDAQEHMFQICKDCLSEQGVAYISYNTFPGWRIRHIIRDAMMFRSRHVQNATERLQEAKNFVGLLAEIAPKQGRLAASFWEEEQKFLDRQNDYYLLHEYLEDENHPCYFHEFAARLRSYDLQYLAEADFGMTSTFNASPEVRKAVAALAGDIIQSEQYMDFVRNRLFRQTLICRTSHSISHQIVPENATTMHFATSAIPEQPINNFCDGDRITFSRTGSTMTTTEPIVKAAMVVLQEHWPHFVSFENLIVAARSRVQPGPIIVDQARFHDDERKLAEVLTRCFVTGHIDMSVAPPCPELTIGLKPRVSPLVRHQASLSNEVTNQWHRTTNLTDLQRRVVRLLDGARDRTMLVKELVQTALQGELVIQEGGHQVRDAVRIQQVLEQGIESSLESIARVGLLIVDSTKN